MKKLLLISLAAATFASCSKDKDPVIIVPPSSGSTMTLEGTVTNAGANAENSVYVDFSTDKQTSLLRHSWDLGFYNGNEFKIILNNTKGVTAIVVNKTDINAVTEADVDLNTLKVGQGQGTLAIIDNPLEENILNKTAIAVVSVTDADNKVYVINAKGLTNSTAVPVDSAFKVRILRKGTGYTLQYARLKETSFKTLEISKNSDYNFQFVSLFSGSLVNAEPQKTNWDITWTWSIYYTNSGTDILPYGFSDLIFINNVGGTAVVERIYATSDIATAAYATFNKDSVAKYTFSSKRDAIGSNWRLTVASGSEPAGIRKNRFYVIKDAAGNTYKLKFLAMGVASDGGTRGKPQISYELIK